MKTKAGSAEASGSAIELARKLANAGRFRDALVAVGDSSTGRERVPFGVLRAELLARVGEYSAAQRMIDGLVDSRNLQMGDRASCEFIRGSIEFETGNNRGALLHFQRAIAYAKQADNLEQICWAQLRLLLLQTEICEPEALTPFIDELRRNILRVDRPVLLAALHIYLGIIEGKRGLLERSARHSIIGTHLLASEPNVWLEAAAENNLLNVAAQRADLDTAKRHGERALGLAEASGAAGIRARTLGNLSHISYMLGRFEEAVNYGERAVALLPSSWVRSGVFDTLARVRLAQNRLDDCDAALAEVDHLIERAGHQGTYMAREVELTRTQLLASQGRYCDALRHCDRALELAASAGDDLVHMYARIIKATLLCGTGRVSDARSLLLNANESFDGHPDIHAQYEQAIAAGLDVSRTPETKDAHLERAGRIFDCLRNTGAYRPMLELVRSTIPGSDSAFTSDHEAECDQTVPAQHAGRALQDASALILHIGRSDLVAVDVIRLIEACDCAVWAEARHTKDSALRVLCSCGAKSANSHYRSRMRIPIEENAETRIEITVEPRADLESLANLNAINALVKAAASLERARVEQKERLALWPIEEMPIDNGDAVTIGHMRELMTFARRVAATNVSVLITGESGTGKEIIARAIHAFSPRAKKPFVPVNCTAVPRDLLESHLFGHRRGAFTGAERDHPGLIRAARDGTLFLDEIGELGLDLQPKLLRFLESGEINPLGEPAPFRVDVRIIAATNTDLEDAVRDGRFREDLFYRLNVIRLRVPPLRERRDEIPALVNAFVARATDEFRKGQVRFAEETMECLLVYRWPGNVRQLQNEVRRVVALAEPNTVIGPQALSDTIRESAPSAERRVNSGEIAVPLRDKLTPTLARIEREMIRTALGDHHGRVDHAARALGISRKGLYLKRQRLGL